MVHAELRQHFYRRLSPFYLQGELQALYHWCVQELEGWSRAAAYTNNERVVDGSALAKWDAVIDRLIQKEPVQYIFHTASFCGLDLYVDQNVLIPRPETEELVDIVLKEQQRSQLGVLDIGTGSGCIALALKLQRPSWTVAGCDCSPEALTVARKNASDHRLDVQWMELDVRDPKLSLMGYDVIVSNPPYIPFDLQGSLDKEVEAFEPKIALFAPETDPFYFFRRIVQVAESSGVDHVYFETHATDEDMLEEVFHAEWGGKHSFIRDLAGKSRFVHLFK